jgi:mono/diheme cytochrome c family protein
MKTSTQALLAALFVPVLSVGGVFAVADVFQRKPVHGPSPVQDGKRPGSAPHPVSTADAIAMGRNLFVQSCARCHGNDARGNGEDDDGPDLHGLRISDARIRSVMLKGVKGEMPSFAKKFSADDATALIFYLRSLPRDG